MREDEVVRFLAKAETYGETGAVARVETHCAIVFLIGARAFKLKKPVRFSYLDFSTPALRRAAIERELQLNARTAPMLYRRVVPVTRQADGRLALGGAGEPVDWVLEMARFEEAGRLDHVAQRGELTETLAEALADAVSAAHRTAPVSRSRDYGGTAANERLCDMAAAELVRFAGTMFGANEVAAIDRGLRAALASIATLLDIRRETGFVRRCHGDLHLGNVTLIGGKPVLFDCIEFSEDIGTIDVLYDLAFLLMDLAHRGLPAIANRVFNRYVENAALDEAEAMMAGLALMPFFLASRAIVRTQVEARIATQSGKPPDMARRYFTEAEVHLNPPAPHLIAVGGLSGSGKSTLARRLGPRLGRAYGALVLRSDATRKRLHGVPPEERLAPEAYRPEVSVRVYGLLYDWAARALKAGETVILDAVFTRPADRLAVEEVAALAGARFTGLWLDAPAPILRDRVAARRKDASDATLAVLEVQLREETGAMLWTRLDASGTAEAALRQALGSLAPGGGG